MLPIRSGDSLSRSPRPTRTGSAASRWTAPEIECHDASSAYTIGQLTAFGTPEEAALAEWETYPSAQAYVVRVDYTDERNAVVATDTVASHPMWNYCERTSAGWIYTGDHN